MRKITLGLALFCLLAVATTLTAQSGDVKINEVNVGTDVWVEIANLGSAPVDISGWHILGYWDNPADGVPEVNETIPGVAGSLTTVLQPNECLIYQEAAGVPAVPAGTQTFVFAAPVNWFSGLPGTIGLYDDLGNGVDYMAWSSVNAWEAPYEAATFLALPVAPAAALAVWNGSGQPVYNGVTFGANDNANYRHTRTDTDSGADWTNDGNGSATSGTPGVLNHFQTEMVTCTTAGFTPAVALLAQFVPSTLTGCGPLLVGFKNNSLGDCELGLGLGFATWDFDATANPGVDTSILWHESRSFNASRDVTLTIIDSMGNFSVSSAQTVAVLGAGAIVPRAIPVSENFENFPALVSDPCGGGLVPDPATGWEYRGADPGSQFQILDWNSMTAQIGWTFPGDATPSAGPFVCVLDTASGLATNEMVLHFDAFSSATGEFKIRYAVMEDFDECHDTDIFFLQDGYTTGQGLTLNCGTNTTSSSGFPGFGGFTEIEMLKYNTAIDAQNGQRTWNYFEHIVDAAFMTANGLVMNGDMRFGFRQRDNVWFQGNDGILFDMVEVLPYPDAPGPGQPYTAGVAGMDINGCVNGNSNAAGNTMDPNGPYFANLTAGGAMNFSFDGAPNQAIILFVGPLNPGAMVTPIGQIDILGPSIVANGAASTGFLGAAFVTDGFGQNSISMTAGSAVGSGLTLTFQAAIFTGGPTVVGFTNACEVTF